LAKSDLTCPRFTHTPNPKSCATNASPSKRSTFSIAPSAAKLSGDVLRRELRDFHDRWIARGVLWLRPSLVPFDPDAWLSAAEMAELADVKPGTVREWHYRGHITSIESADGSPLYNVLEVVRYQARRNLGKM
jgi:hypothetical protein